MATYNRFRVSFEGKFKHGQSFWLECCVVDVWTPTAAVANTNFLLATNKYWYGSEIGHGHQWPKKLSSWNQLSFLVANFDPNSYWFVPYRGCTNCWGVHPSADVPCRLAPQIQSSTLSEHGHSLSPATVHGAGAPKRNHRLTPFRGDRFPKMMGTMGHPESTIWFLDVPCFSIEININKPSRSIQLLGCPHDKVSWKPQQPPLQILLSSMTVSLIQTAFLQNLPGRQWKWRIHWMPWALSWRLQVTVVQVPWSKLPNLQPQNNKQRKSEHSLNVSHPRYPSVKQCQPCIKSDTWH